MEKIMDNGQEIIKILMLSDFHVGSSTGLLPPHAKEFDGEVLTPKPQNKIQRWLWRNYVTDLTEIGIVHIIINAADNIEGAQTKIMGRTLRTSDIDIQKAWAVKCNQMAIDICHPENYIGVSGTNYHNRLYGNCNADISIYKALEMANKNIKFVYGDNVVIKIGQMVWSIAHPYPTTEYKAPPIEKLINQHAKEFYFRRSQRIDVFARGHAHAYIWQRYPEGVTGFVSPCQQPTSAYGREKAYMTVRNPDVGVLGITQEGKDLIPKPLLHHWRQS